MKSNLLFDLARQSPPLAYLHGKPALNGCIRQVPEHFIVNEVLGFTPSGEGEHYLFRVRKRDGNTQDVAQALAKVLGVHPKLVSWSGLKDKRAVTTQWLGVHAPNRLDVCLPELNETLRQATVLECTQHNKKLRIGSHQANAFELTVTNLMGDVHTLHERLDAIEKKGVPNYFGEQRFGRAEKNLQLADQLLFQGQRLSRQKKSLALSSARSFIFNQRVSGMVQDGSFTQPEVGHRLMLEGSHSVFSVDDVQSACQRLQTGDVHPVQCLLGQGSDALNHQAVQQALEKQGVKNQWRAARVIPKKMGWEVDNEARQLTVQFELPRGAYATSVLRELINT